MFGHVGHGVRQLDRGQGVFLSRGTFFGGPDVLVVLDAVHLRVIQCELCDDFGQFSDRHRQPDETLTVFCFGLRNRRDRLLSVLDQESPWPLRDRMQQPTHPRVVPHDDHLAVSELSLALRERRFVVAYEMVWPRL